MAIRWIVVLLGATFTLAGCGGDETGESTGSGGSQATGGSGGHGGAAGGSGSAGAAGDSGAGGASGSSGSSGAGGAAGAGAAGYAPPYAPDFALNRRIPTGVATDVRSDAIVQRLDLNTAQNKVSVANYLDVPTVYVVSPTDPFYELAFEGETVRFRVPAGAIQGGGSDEPVELLDPDHPDYGPYTELRMWRAGFDHTGQLLTAQGAGLFHYNSDGAILNQDGTPSHAKPFWGWGTGSGLSYLAGLVRPQEVAQGEIRHAIRFAYSNCDSSDQFRPPATKTDQPKNCTGTQAPPEQRMDMGMRLQLDAGVDCATRTAPEKEASAPETRFVRMVCRALQDYGMIMLDGTGPGGLVLYLEHQETARWGDVIGDEAWESYGYLLRDGDTPDDGFQRVGTDGIPWDRLRVLATSVFP